MIAVSEELTALRAAHSSQFVIITGNELAKAAAELACRNLARLRMTQQAGLELRSTTVVFAQVVWRAPVGCQVNPADSSSQSTSKPG